MAVQIVRHVKPMADLFGNQGSHQMGEEPPKPRLKFRFKCWNDDPQRASNGQPLTNQPFDVVEIDVYATDLEDALKKARELINRSHHDILKIHEPK